jgi:hypothetical protein
MTILAPAGFSQTVDLGALQISFQGSNPEPFLPDYRESVSQAFIQKSMMGMSMITLQLTDPQRIILNSVVESGINDGATLSYDGLEFDFTQFMKASDQLQLVFESHLVHQLKTSWGATGRSVSNDVTPFVRQLVTEAGGQLYGPDYKQIWPYITKAAIPAVPLARGTSADPNENSWVAISRLASSVGWRLWEDAGTVFFGPDEFWLGKVGIDGPAPAGSPPPINSILASQNNLKDVQIPILQEFTNSIMLIDFDWNYGAPYGQAQATVSMDNFSYYIGQAVYLDNMGPASKDKNGNAIYWLVAGVQRDLYLSQGTVTLQVPMPIDDYIAPTSKPQAGAPLVPTNPIIR